MVLRIEETESCVSFLTTRLTASSLRRTLEARPSECLTRRTASPWIRATQTSAFSQLAAHRIFLQWARQDGSAETAESSEP